MIFKTINIQHKTKAVLKSTSDHPSYLLWCLNIFFLTQEWKVRTWLNTHHKKIFLKLMRNTQQIKAKSLMIFFHNDKKKSLPCISTHKSIHPVLMNQKKKNLMRNKMSVCRKAAVPVYYGKYASLTINWVPAAVSPIIARISIINIF